MPYELDNRLVIGIASSALFDLTESDAYFRKNGESAYRKYQDERLDDPLDPGVAFGFIRQLLKLNSLRPADPLVEVIILSRNDPSTGLRVMRSIQHHDLPITRAIFTRGASPFEYISALKMSLFLSADDQSVRAALRRGFLPGSSSTRRSTWIRTTTKYASRSISTASSPTTRRNGSSRRRVVCRPSANTRRLTETSRCTQVRSLSSSGI